MFTPVVAFGTKVRSSARRADDTRRALARASREQLPEPAGDELDRLALELALPRLVALEHRSRAGAERAMVEEDDSGSSRKSSRTRSEYVVRPHPVPWIERCTRAPGQSVRARTGLQAELAQALGISELTASVLVRRGYTDPRGRARVPRRRAAAARPVPARRHARRVRADPRCRRRRARRICVHGDYDVDGIAATTLAVLLLRELGAEVDWHLPSRFDEGYGVTRATLERLADEGCGLVLTVDCGITAVEEVAEAKARGLEVIVTDHHRPGATLPDCPIVATTPVRLSVPGALRHRRRLQARSGALRRRLGDPEAPPRPRRARDDRRRRARCSTRTAAW